ncbi:MAG: membrane protein insertase YidC [Alphaproteobacteria bacterium]
MDRRTLLFIAISVGIIVAYQELVLKRLVPPKPAGQVQSSPVGGTTGGDKSADADRPAASAPQAAGAPAPGAVAAPSEKPGERPQGRTVTIESDLYKAVIDTAGGRIRSYTLKNFRSTNEKDSPDLELVVPGSESELPMGLEIRGANKWSDVQSTYATDAADRRITGSEQAEVELRSELGGQPVVKRLTFRGDAYPIALHVETPAASALPAELTAGSEAQPAAIALVWSKSISKATQAGGVFEGAASLVDGKLVQTAPTALEKPENLAGTIRWSGFEDHYFLSAVAPERANQVALRSRGDAIEARILTPREGTGAVSNDYTIFMGPKESSVLEAAGHDFVRGLNLGWFGPISLLLLKILNLFHRVTHNYGVDIILLTVLVKLAFWPLTQKSFQSMREMQRLQPEMQRLREKYKDDPTQLNKEVMELYKRHKVNPLGGCLPMVLQIPVFFGLYQALSSTIQLRHAPFMLWIHDLAAPERLSILGWGIPVLTILLGVTMFLQQRMSPPAGDPAQQRVMMFMPLLFTYMFIGFPAGLTLYWLTNNILTIAQQYFILKSNPPPATA